MKYVIVLILITLFGALTYVNLFEQETRRQQNKDN